MEGAVVTGIKDYELGGGLVAVGGKVLYVEVERGVIKRIGLVDILIEGILEPAVRHVETRLELCLELLVVLAARPGTVEMVAKVLHYIFLGILHHVGTLRGVQVLGIGGAMVMQHGHVEFGAHYLVHQMRLHGHYI